MEKPQEEQSVEQLKARVYDLLGARQLIDQEIQFTNNKIKEHVEKSNPKPEGEIPKDDERKEIVEG